MTSKRIEGLLNTCKQMVSQIKNERNILLILFFFAFFIRTFYVYKTFQEEGDSNWNDAKLYVYYGSEFAKGNFFPVVPEINQKLIIPPVIPLVYAFSQLIMPGNYWPFFIYNILLTSFLVVLLFFIGNILRDKTLGYFMAIWGLLFFDYFKYDPQVLKEPTICFLLILMVFMALKYQQGGRKTSHLLGIGLSFLLLIHTDERYFAFLPVIILLPFIADKSLRFTKTGGFQSLYLTIFIVVLMIPWTIRNYKEYNEIVLLTPRTTAITSKFWGSNLSSINFEGDWRANKLKEAQNDRAKDYASQYGIEPHIQKEFESRFKAFINYWQPTYFKPAFIQYGYRFQKWSVMHNLTSILFYGIFLPFYIAELIRFVRKRNFLLVWLGAIPLLHSLIHAYMVWPLERYRMPINFIIVLLAMLYVFDLIAGNGKLKQQVQSFLSRNTHIKSNTKEI